MSTQLSIGEGLDEISEVVSTEEKNILMTRPGGIPKGRGQGQEGRQKEEIGKKNTQGDRNMI